jgi:hypothetical protein
MELNPYEAPKEAGYDVATHSAVVPQRSNGVAWTVVIVFLVGGTFMTSVAVMSEESRGVLGGSAAIVLGLLIACAVIYQTWHPPQP